MTYLGTYRVAILQPDSAGDLTAVHTFILPASRVRARMGPDDRDLETAAAVAWELATTDPDDLPHPWAQLADGYQVHARRTFTYGDVMAVTGPEGTGVALRWAGNGWQQLQNWPSSSLPGMSGSRVGP